VAAAATENVNSQSTGKKLVKRSHSANTDNNEIQASNGGGIRSDKS